MPDTLSLYVERNSGAHKLHPLTKLALAGFMLTGALVLPVPWALYGFFLFILIPLALWAGVLKQLLPATLKIALPFAISVFLIQGFLWPGGTPIFTIGPISLKSEGLAFAITSTGRILIVVGSFLWFAYTTRPDTLMFSLTQRGLSASLSYVIIATIQIIPRLQARAGAILEAQQARGLETQGNLPHRARVLFPIVMPLILSSLLDVEERAVAIEARAFNYSGTKTSLAIIHEARWELAFRWILLLSTIALVGFRLWFTFVYRQP